jgi:hypothetical protein
MRRLVALAAAMPLWLSVRQTDRKGGYGEPVGPMCGDTVQII